MTLGWTTLFLADDDWRVGLCDRSHTTVHTVPRPVIDDDANSVRRHVEACVQAVRTLGAKPRPLVLCIPSTWCFAATLPTDGLLRRQRYDGLVYRLEERLPVDAEGITAVFHEDPEQSVALGIATRTQPVKHVLHALDEAGLSVAAITPTALLCDDALPADVSGDQTTCRLIMLDQERVEVLLRHRDRLGAWRSVAANRSRIETEVGFLGLDLANPPVFHTLGLPHGLCPAQITAETTKITSSPTATEIFQAATRHAYFCINRSARLPADLSRGELACLGLAARIAGPARVAALALSLLLSTVGSLTWWGAHQHTEAAARTTQTQTDLFRRTFPEQRVPAAPLSRFRSEAAQARGQAGGGDVVPPRGRTLQDLQSVLDGLPDPARHRFRVLELRVSNDQIYMDGQARSHAAGDLVVRSLHPKVRFRFAPPRTQQLPPTSGPGVSFTLVGTPAEKDPS